MLSHQRGARARACRVGTRGGTVRCPAAEQLPSEPKHDSGQNVTAAFEGWYKNPDGTFSILLGYYNRNLKQDLDIPIGPNNRIEPGGPDRGQPTHFVPGRQWGMFTVTVPKDFGDKKLTWTLDGEWFHHRGSGRSQSALGNFAFHRCDRKHTALCGILRDRSLRVGPALRHHFHDSHGMLNRFRSRRGLRTTQRRFQGLLALLSRLPPVTVTWTKFRGPGTVTFSNARSAAEKAEFPASAERYVYR